MKRKITTKLGVSIASIAVSVILLAAVSFAWYTINTKAEAGDLTITFKGIKWPFEAGYETQVENEAGELETKIAWGKEINLSDYLHKLGLDECQLRPISTYDLQHWYLSLYSVSGDVNGFEEAQLDTVANKSRDEDASGKDQSSGSVIYFDIWVREMNDGEQAGLKLSTVEPRSTESGVTYGDALVDETVEGTYILTKPSEAVDKDEKKTGKYAYKEVDEDGNVTYSLSDDDSNKDALNSIRIGFAALDSNNNITSYFIYEPNADRHSEGAHYSYKDPDDENYDARNDKTNYILNDVINVDDAEAVKEYNYDSAPVLTDTGTSRFADYLSLTSPALVLDKTAPRVSCNEVNGSKAAKYRENVKVTYQASNGERVKLTDAATVDSGEEYDLLYTYVPTLVKRNGAEVVELHPQMTVRQLGSDWDMSKVITKTPNTTNDDINSSCVKTFGQFIDEAPALCTVTNGKPQKIRIFIWIEGQDVDCWNEIAGGAIFANLEFTGVEIADVEAAGEDS